MIKKQENSVGKTLTKKQVNRLQKTLNDIISKSLYGSSGEANSNELNTALRVYKLLKELDLKVKYEKDVVRELSGENVYDYDFLNDKPK